MEKAKIVSPELAAALDRKAAADAKIEARKKANAELDAMREALDAAALAEAIVEHGEVGDGIGTVSTALGRVIVKRPSAGRWKRHEKDVQTRSDTKLEEIAKRMVLDHLVYPEEPKYFALVDKYPALPPELLAMVTNLARGGEKALSGE